MKKIAITGSSGYIGTAMCNLPNVTSLTCDITNPEETRLAIEQAQPDIVVNLACLSKVDFCEEEKNKEQVIAVNVRGAYNVSLATEELGGIPTVQISTDHLFAGKRFRYGPYGEKTIPKPVNFYGMSKMAMEQISSAFDHVKIVRTSRIFDISSIDFTSGISYPTFIKRTFMYRPHFIKAFMEYLDMWKEMPKVLNISGSESVSWYDFMRVVFKEYNKHPEDIFKRTGEMPGKYAPRPHAAGLKTSLSAKYGITQFSYKDGIGVMRKQSLTKELGYV